MLAINDEKIIIVSHPNGREEEEQAWRLFLKTKVDEIVIDEERGV